MCTFDYYIFFVVFLFLFLTCIIQLFIYLVYYSIAMQLVAQEFPSGSIKLYDLILSYPILSYLSKPTDTVHPPIPGEEEDAAVHVDEVAEGVDIGAGQAAAPAEVERDAGGQRQRHQQVGHRQVHGVHHRGGGRPRPPAEHVERQAVEQHAHHQQHAVGHLGGRNIRLKYIYQQCNLDLSKSVNSQQTFCKTTKYIMFPIFLYSAYSLYIYYSIVFILILY